MKLRTFITHPWADRGWLICTLALLAFTVVDWLRQDPADVSTKRVLWVAAALTCLALGPVVRRPMAKWSTLVAGTVCVLAALLQL